MYKCYKEVKVLVDEKIIECMYCSFQFDAEEHKIGLILTKCPNCKRVIEYGEFADINPNIS